MTTEKKALIAGGLLIVLLLFIAAVNFIVNNSQLINEVDDEFEENTDGAINERQTGPDPANASYYIGGEEIKLENGKSEIDAAPGSASKITTEIFGDPVTGDMDGDGVADAGVILVESGGGSGSFYYAAVAIQNPDDKSYTGSNAILLGDRIAPQTKGIEDEIYTVNYADRNAEEDFSTDPSIAVSKNFTYDGAALIEEGITDEEI